MCRWDIKVTQTQLSVLALITNLITVLGCKIVTIKIIPLFLFAPSVTFEE